MRTSVLRYPLAIALLLICAIVSGCPEQAADRGLPDLNRDLELEVRLTAADFSIVNSVSTVIEESWSIISEEFEIPETISLEFAGKDIVLPETSPDNAIGLDLSNGRSIAVYLYNPPRRPSYGEIIPLAMTHYLIPAVDLNIVLLLVCFQYDTDGSNVGIGVRSVNLEGIETSAPFAVALGYDELAGKFFYDEFIESDAPQAVAGREDWDQGILLLTGLDSTTVLSTYLPMY